MAPIVTRFAPSPTGDLHLGGAYVALASWWLARRSPAGRYVLRMEDIDTPRVVTGSAERIVADLVGLGLAWDEGPIAQSERLHLYAAAIDALNARGLVYPCDCSRADIARVASAPHAGEETVYPGLCRDRDPGRPMKRAPALRMRVPDEEISFDDGVAGRFVQNLARDVGDFVLRRGDGVYAYQLVVVVDDLDMGMTDVVRGADLLASTPRQIFLARMLGATAPRYHHVPLVVDAHGERLAKRTPGAHVRALREAGIAPEEILGELAHGLGIMPSGQPCSLRDLLASTAAQLAPRAFRIPSRWLAPKR
ncbi:tRNA glutamyl-Q(34) synthetase GluQRS [Pendulispora brunnea]|uniref:Glutamyl-Q tRNA(Asp) synthetase n=1 Tax=Pendulispora brunnea TaxID=2905690 RepID=A0ABZ2K4P6_9BACT